MKPLLQQFLVASLSIKRSWDIAPRRLKICAFEEQDLLGTFQVRKRERGKGAAHNEVSLWTCMGTYTVHGDLHTKLTNYIC